MSWEVQPNTILYLLLSPLHTLILYVFFALSLFFVLLLLFFTLQLSGSNGREYHFKHKVLQHARTRRSIPHTRVLKREPLVCIELLSFSFYRKILLYFIIIFTPHLWSFQLFNNGDKFSILLENYDIKTATHKDF